MKDNPQEGMGLACYMIGAVVVFFLVLAIFRFVRTGTENEGTDNMQPPAQLMMLTR